MTVDRTPMIRPEVLRRLSELSPTRALVQIAFEWLVIAVVIYFVARFPTVPTYLVAVLVIGTRQHALAIIMHEATHHRISKNRTFNDFVGNFFCAWPIFVSVEGYRANHLPHHQHLNTDRDPDWMRKTGSDEWVFPKSRWEMAKLYACDFFLFNTFDLLKRVALFSGAGKSTENTGIRWGRIAFYLTLAAVLTWTGFWVQYLALWVLPVFTTLKVLLRNRSIAEHFEIFQPGYDRDTTIGGTRTVLSNPIERWLVAPNGISYHVEHHLYPSVPFHHLPELHRELMKNERFRSNVKITKSYLSLFGEVAREPRP